jgi:hypothetical protein
MAVLDAGCDNRHVLGAVDGGGGNGGEPPTGAGNQGGAASPCDGAAAFVCPDGSLVCSLAACPPTGGTSGGGQGGSSMATGTAGSGQDGAIVEPIETWTGYIENKKFPSGSDTVTLSFSSGPDGHLTGTVTLGNGTPPPPATNPDVGYPPGYWPQQAVPSGLPTYVAEGYTYPIHDGTVSGRRMQFAINLIDLWQGWCALQMPPPGSYLCMATKGGSVSADRTTCENSNPVTGANESVDCGKFALCVLEMVCRCNNPSSATQCTPMDGGVPIRFDVSVDGNLADGSVDGAFGVRNAHFTKDP